jgi:predicted nucleic acid-binding protein
MRAAKPPRVLIDINVMLDLLLEREPFAKQAGALLTQVEEGRAEGFIAGHTITTIFFLVKRERGRRATEQAVSDVLRIATVVPLEQADYHQAILLALNDFEDAVQTAAAMRIAADFIATRNETDFRSSPVPPKSPAELVALISSAS